MSLLGHNLRRRNAAAEKSDAPVEKHVPHETSPAPVAKAPAAKAKPKKKGAK